MLAQDAIAILEIQQLLYRYCRGVDRGEISTLKSVYHPGANDRHGSYDGPGDAFADQLVAGMDAVGGTGQHHITNMLIDVEGDTAVGESYFLAYHPSPVPHSGKIGLAVAGGRYLDRFEKRDGAWKLADRVVAMDFSVAPADQPAWAVQAHYPTGARREADVSHGLFAAERAP